MRLFVLILTLIFGISELSAQAIPLISPDRDMTFTKRNTLDEDSAYFFIRTTSVADEADGTAYYFNVNIDTAGGGCETDTTFMGRKALLLDDIYQTYVFFNDQQDSIFIRTDVELYDSWVFYTWPDGNYIKAQANNKIFKPIMPGVNDTIVRIKLSVFDPSNNPLDIWPDNQKFDLSEQYGLAELYNFYAFPNDQELILLRGVSNPDTAITDVSAHAALDIAPGYEMHYEEFFEDEGYFDLHRLYKLFVLDTLHNDLSVVITSQRTLWQELTLSGTTDTLQVLDTITVEYFYSDLAQLDTPELQWMQYDDGAFAFSDFILEPDTYSGIRHKWLYGGYSSTSEDTLCASILTGASPWPLKLYGNELGIMYKLDSVLELLVPDAIDPDYGNVELQMVYFQKGLITWGEPIDFYELGFTGINEPAELAFQIYPNPAEDHLQISGVQQAAYINIYSADGRLLRSEPYYSYISISELPSGIYLLQIMSDEGTGTTTFIKQ